MKYIKYLFITAIALLVLWIDLPRPIPIKFNAFGRDVNTRIPTLAFNFQVGDRIVRKEFKTQLGLDLKGGSHLVFEADTSSVSQADLEDALASSQDIIERRVNLFGVSEPVVRTVQSGNVYRIEVDLPGVTDIAQASSLIGQT